MILLKSLHFDGFVCYCGFLRSSSELLQFCNILDFFDISAACSLWKIVFCCTAWAVSDASFNFSLIRIPRHLANNNIKLFQWRFLPLLKQTHQFTYNKSYLDSGCANTREPKDDYGAMLHGTFLRLQCFAFRNHLFRRSVRAFVFFVSAVVWVLLRSVFERWFDGSLLHLTADDVSLVCQVRNHEFTIPAALAVVVSLSLSSQSTTVSIFAAMHHFCLFHCTRSPVARISPCVPWTSVLCTSRSRVHSWWLIFQLFQICVCFCLACHFLVFCVICIVFLW